ncbi:MAG TPA: polysaccharide lyase family protein, partial [Bacteroidales bacterium]|nr:polysaccharide lyase family protein [Bacteroidales bacterium]
MTRFILALLFISFSLLSCSRDTKIVWSIGSEDGSSADLALGPDGFRDFLSRDFGFEDKYFLIGHSVDRESFPYVLPGPADTWGGTWSTAGWRTHQINIFFGIREMQGKSMHGKWKLVISLLDFSGRFPPLLKASINEYDRKIRLFAGEYQPADQVHPGMTAAVTDTASISGDLKDIHPRKIEIPVDPGIIKRGGNCITLTILEGSWIMFDELHLEAPGNVSLIVPEEVFIREVKASSYELDQGEDRIQPLLVTAVHLDGSPEISVELDGKEIFRERTEAGICQFEVPMPATDKRIKSGYKIYSGNVLLEEGTVIRSPQKAGTLADYVDTRTGTAHSRWMIAPGPWMPFSMVKLSPDNQNPGWQAGYEPSFESIGTFSHIHEWTLGGLGIFASNGRLITKIGDELLDEEGYRSGINKRTEEAPLGYYRADLTRYGIKAELTATTRCGFLRFTFPSGRDSSRILVDLKVPAEYSYELKEINIKATGKNRIEGFCRQFAPRVWSNDAQQDYTVHF